MEQTATIPKPNLLYFLKEILSNGVIIKGKAPAFENIGGNRGVIALDPDKPEDQEFIEGLTDFANRGVGGVVKISAETYAQKKSQPISNPSSKHSAFDLRIRRLVAPAAKRQPPPAPAEATAGAVAPPADPPPAAPPAEVGTEEPKPFQPPTRRISRKKPDKDAEPTAPPE